MLFHSFTYLIFLGLATLAYWKSGRAVRLWMLFAASIIFYSFWRWEYVFCMIATLTLDFFIAQRIDAHTDQRRKKRYLLVSLMFNLGLLFYFKYTLFVVGEINGLLSHFGHETFSVPWTIILPIGISFYTFQSIGYVVDVYRGYKKPVREYPLYAAFVTFFPQLIAGPILRAKEVIPQLDIKPKFNSSDLALGLQIILSGLFLKVILADNIAPFVDEAFATPAQTLSALDVWVMAFLFGFQIYFDFSAYSLIAIGSAKLMGIHFPANFNFPYSATSPKDFWKRWHISLSSWIRDYLYLPLAGLKPRDTSVDGLSDAAEQTDHTHATQKQLLIALIATWIIMGFWHGANWTFAAWGAWHAALIIGYRFVTPLLPAGIRKFPVLGWLVTLPLIMLGWIFFRANTIQDALHMLSNILSPAQYLNFDRWGTNYVWELLPININPMAYLLASTMLIGVIGCWAFKRYIWDGPLSTSLRRVMLMTFIAGQTFFVFVFLQSTGQFIYFQF